MSQKIEELKKDINKSIRIYIIGCCIFIFLALVFVWFGYYIIRSHNVHDLPIQLTVLSLGGGLLLWEIIKAFRIKTSLPSGFKAITDADFPNLFVLINEVTSALNISPVRKVYLCPEATAAVFIQPQLRNLIFEPQRNVVVGLGFLTQMDDDEIRAMLYHEFGHYAHEGMKSTVSVYSIGQFSRSFVSVKKIKKEGSYEKGIKLQLLMFTHFTVHMCSLINKSFLQLSKHLEYEADDVAVKYVGASTLQRSLLHAACIRYNYEVVQWGIQQLQSQNIHVDNQYLALSFVSNYSRPTRCLLSEDVVRRVERLGELEIDNSVATNAVQQAALSLVSDNEETQRICTARQFAQWLRQGFEIYTKQLLWETSVQLEIHLDKRKHKLPYFDGLYKLLLDDKEIGTGNFIKGYTLKLKTSPGKHKLTTYAPSGIISTPFDFDVAQDKSYRIEMDYKIYAKDGVYDVYGDKINII